MNLLKTERWRSKKYLDWVRDQDCIRCQAPPRSEAHHIKGVGGYSGTGLKAPDSLCMPLCVRCHGVVHRDSDTWDKQWQWISRTLERAIREGVLKVA